MTITDSIIAPQAPPAETETDAAWFLRCLFEDAQDYARDLIVWTLPDKVTRKLTLCTPAAAHAMAESAAGKNVYFGVGLTGDVDDSGKSRGKLENIMGITCLWFDIDIAGATHPEATKFGPKPLPKSEDAAMGILHRVGLPPSIIVHSGGGLHIYWLLKEPWIFADAKEREVCQAFVRRWGKSVCEVGRELGYRLDNLSDLTRVLRVPGTRNRKNGEDLPVAIRLPETGTPLESIPRYNPDDFEEHFRESTSLPSARRAATAGTVNAFTSDPRAEVPAEKLDALKSNDEKFRLSWERKREDLKDSSASGYELSLMTLAAAAGWTDQELANLSIHWRRMQGETPEKCLRRDYLKNLIAKAKAPHEDRDADDGEDDELPPTQLSPEEKAHRLKILRIVTRLPSLVGLIRRGETDSVFDLRLSGGIVPIGPIQKLLSFDHVQCCIADAAGVVMKPKNRKLWKAKFAEWLLSLETVERSFSDSDELQSWLDSFAQRTSCPTVLSHEIERLGEYLEAGYGFRLKGRLHIPLLKFWQHVTSDLRCSFPGGQRALAVRLRRCGFRDSQVAAKHNRKLINRRLWISPQGENDDPSAT